MNDTKQDPSPDALEAALDAALRKALPAPAVPAGFREGLRAAIVRSSQVDHGALRRELEREEREALRSMQQGYVRVRRQALFTMLLASFVAGAGAIFAMPLLVARFGTQAPAVLAGAAGLAALALGIGFALRNRWQSLSAPLLRWLP
jgi:hypothetical protein